MPFTTAGKNMLLDALRGVTPTTPATHAGLFAEGVPKSVTGIASTDIFTSAAHGYANGDLVVLSGLTGGATLVVGDAYFVINAATNTFQLSELQGGAAADFSTDLTSGTVTKLIELAGGVPAYARKPVTLTAASDGLTALTASALFDVPSGATVSYMGYFSALTAGITLGIVDVVNETFAGQGTYNLNTATIDLNL